MPSKQTVERVEQVWSKLLPLLNKTKNELETGERINLPLNDVVNYMSMIYTVFVSPLSGYHISLTRCAMYQGGDLITQKLHTYIDSYCQEILSSFTNLYRIPLIQNLTKKWKSFQTFTTILSTIFEYLV